MRFLLLYILLYVFILDVSNCTNEQDDWQNEQRKRQKIGDHQHLNLGYGQPQRGHGARIQGHNSNLQGNQAINLLPDKLRQNRNDLINSVDLSQKGKQPQQNPLQNQLHQFIKVKQEQGDNEYMGQQPKQQVQGENEKQPRVTIHLDDSSDDSSLELIDGKGKKAQIPYTSELKQNIRNLQHSVLGSSKTIGPLQQNIGNIQQPPSSSGLKRKQYDRSQKRIVTVISVNKYNFTNMVQHCKRLLFEEMIVV